MEDALDQAIARLVREAEAPLQELWSDEARAASILARRRHGSPGLRMTPRKAHARAPHREEPAQHTAQAPRPHHQATAHSTPHKAAPVRRAAHHAPKHAAPAHASRHAPTPHHSNAPPKAPRKGSPTEAPEARPGNTELERVRTAMGRSERDAFDRGYTAAKKKGFTGSRAAYMHDVGRRYETESEGNSTAETWLSGDTVTRLRKITKRKRESAMDALDREVGRVIRETDAACFGTHQYDRLMEKWSDAARAASAAARRARAGGGNRDWRKAARNAFAGSKGGRKIAVDSVKRNLKNERSLAKYANSMGTGSAIAGDKRLSNRYAKAQSGLWAGAGRAARRAGAKAQRFGAYGTPAGPKSSGARRAKRSILRQFAMSRA